MQYWAAQFFVGLLVELLSFVVTILTKEKPRVAITILVGGTLLAGLVAFGPAIAQHDTAPSPSQVAVAPNAALTAAPSGISASNSAPRSLDPTPPPSPTPAPTPTCSDPPVDWPKTPQEATRDFGGIADNWYPDYFQVNGVGPVKWDQTTWVFQDSPLQPGVALSADGDYIDSNGNVLTLVESSRGDKLWNYNAPLDFPTVQLGQLGRDGRAHMVVRTGSQASHHAMTKRWGYGSVVFQDAEAGVVRLVWCSADQLDAAHQDALNEYDGRDPDQGYTDWMWDDGSGQFSQPPKSS
jgi:hypothetical protein